MRSRQHAASGAAGVQRWMALGYVLVGAALACAMAWPIYDTPRLALVAAVAALLGVGLALAAGLRRWPLWLWLVSVAAAYAVGVVPLAIPSALSSPIAALLGVRDGLTGAVLGWKQLLTLSLPLGDYQAVLAPAFLLFLACTTAATGLSLSASRWAASGVLPVVLMGLFGMAFGPTDPGAPWRFLGMTLESPREVLIGLALVGASLVWLTLRSRLERQAAIAAVRGAVTTVRSRRGSKAAAARHRLLGAAILVASVVAGLAVGPAFADVARRATLRTGVEPVVVVQAQTSPLGRYRASFEKDRFGQPLFTVSGSFSGIDRIAIANLDAWNGEDFSVSADSRFTRLPSSTAASGAQTMEISIEEGFAGIWMPLPAGVQSAPQFGGDRSGQLGDAFYLDRETGAGIEIAQNGADRGLRPGDSYTVEAAPRGTTALGEPGTSSLVDLRNYPQLAAWLKLQAQPRTAAGFQELVTRLRSRGYVSHSLEQDAPSAAWTAALGKQTQYLFQPSYAGHSAFRLEALFQDLVDQQNRLGQNAPSDQLVAGIGDDEQFAAAAAIMARALGYESRVVVGVRLGTGQVGGVAECSRTCTGGNLAAWAEVRARGQAEWAAVDAEPQFTNPPKVVTVNRQLPKNPTVPEQAKADAAQPPASQRNNQESGRAATTGLPEWLDAILPILRAAGLGVATLVLAALPFLVVVFAKRWRRRARRAALVPEVALVGAWEDVVDSWVDGGARLSAGTRRDVAASIGTPDAAALAVLADRAVFAEHPPPREHADEAWALADSERRRMAGERDFWRKLGAAVNPSSFLRSLALPRVVARLFPVVSSKETS